MLSPLVYTGIMSWFQNVSITNDSAESTVSAAQVNELHINSDVDSSAISQHHTLGTLATQASPGDHVHDGRSSKRIKFSDIEGGWMNVDGGIPSTIYTPIPHLDGGSI
jgi:hypothetical protein